MASGEDPERREPEPAGPRAGFLRTLKAVLWSFLGVRRRRGYEEDTSRLNPVYVILAGLFATAVFVVVLILVVRTVVAHA